MEDRDLIDTLDKAIKFNGGVFKTLRQSSFICKMLDKNFGSEFEVNIAGIDESIITGKTVFLEYMLRFADYGHRSYRRVGYVYEYDNFGVIRKWKLRFTYPSNGPSVINSDKTELVFVRGQVNTEHLIEEIKAAALTSNYVAAVGQIVETQFTVKFTKMCYTNIGFGRITGSNMVVLHDTNGNELIWFGSTAEAYKLKQGNVVTIKGKVKAHKEYNGKKQTVLTRCKILEVA